MPLGAWNLQSQIVTPPIRVAVCNYVAPCSPDHISRQSSTFSLARRPAGLPRVKPNDTACASRSTSAVRKEFATSATRRAARTSPSQSDLIEARAEIARHAVGALTHFADDLPYDIEREREFRGVGLMHMAEASQPLGTENPPQSRLARVIQRLGWCALVLLDLELGLRPRFELQSSRPKLGRQ
jgi:hypothetical protein